MNSVNVIILVQMTGSEKAALLESIGAKSGFDLQQHQQPQQHPQLLSAGTIIMLVTCCLRDRQ